MRVVVFPLALLLAGAVLTASADEVLFKNGDRLTGKIETYDGSKLTISSTVAGKVMVDLKDVKTLSSSGPVALVLVDGTVIHEKLSSGPDGQVTLAPATAPPRVVPLSSIKKLNPPPVRWTGNVLVGATFARGNTDTNNINAAAHLERKGEKDLTTLDVQYLYARQRVVGDGTHETADDLLGKAKYQYYFSTKFYGYANVEGEHDVIAGMALRLAPGIGAGYQWLDTPKLNFNTEAGGGVLYRNYTTDGDSISGNARLAYHFKSKLNDKVNVFHNFQYLPGLNNINNYFFSTDAGIRTSITDKLFGEFKVEYQYDSRPAPGRQSSDIRYIAGVGWNF